MRRPTYRKVFRRICSIAAAILLVMLIISETTAAKPEESVENTESQMRSGSYDAYLAEYGECARPAEEINIQVDRYTAADDTVKVVQNYDDYEGNAVKTSESGYIEWEVDVREAGLYSIYVEYYPIQGKSSSIEREMLINGKVPFSGADHIMFSRVWSDLTEIKRDDRGNDLRPRQTESPRWRSSFLSDYMGYYNEPYLFYFKEGKNTLRFSSVKEPMLIGSITLKQADTVPAYAEVLEQYKEMGYRESTDYIDKIQGENADFKSDPTLYPIYDRTSPATEPYDKSKIRLNTIGGDNWMLPGEWIAWEFEVPEDGLYQISIKGRQNIIRGLYANRRITINGKVPFKEMENVPFKYSTTWQMHTLGGNEPYLFYLKKGKNEIKMEVVLGDLANILRTAEDSVFALNGAYRKILMITGSVPDQYRDYQLGKKLPDVITTLEKQSLILSELSIRLQEYTGQKGSHNAILDRLSYQLKDMAANPRTIQRRLDDFKANVGSLGTWILETRHQPLEIDFIVIHSPDKVDKLPKPDVGFLRRLIHELNALIASYTEDYNSIGNIYDEKSAVDVWISTGRDQAQILKEMIDDTFTYETKIPVNLQLVQPGVLLTATLAGRGPDVALSASMGEPVNYATRNAVADLSGFPDFYQVSKRFMPSAMVPYSFGGGVYALPETQTFPMLFYRKDILDEIGVDVPQTWDDVFEVLPEIQKNHMDFSMPVSDTVNVGAGMISFYTILYQNGGELYQNDGIASALDTETAIEAFKEWTNLYVSYKLPLQFNLANRFRIGEIPLAISDYSLYNYLQVFAPELSGLWDFTPIPGTLKADGTIDRSAPGSGNAVMMMQGAQNKKNSWEFMKWWTDTDTQVRFGREMESLMGAAGRYPTANVAALEQLPWPVKDYRSLTDQWEWVKGNPEVPGGYFTFRHVENAFRAVVYRGEDPRETLLDYVRIINEEIDNKRNEFGLPIREKGGD